MNALESQLQYPFDETMPAPGTRQEVAPGVFWLRMPLPFALDHINLWLLRDRLDGRDGWTIIDCGITNDIIKGHWETIFANELDGLPVLRVLVTHCHPDHVGAGALALQALGCAAVDEPGRLHDRARDVAAAAASARTPAATSRRATSPATA